MSNIIINILYFLIMNPLYNIRSLLGDDQSQNIRDQDKSRKRTKNKSSTTSQASMDIEEEEDEGSHTGSSTRSMSSASNLFIPFNAREMPSESLRNLPAAQITNEMLQAVATRRLRSGRLRLHDRTDADKAASVKAFALERSAFQWLPACCICKERRISDGINMKDETSIPRSGHIKNNYPGQNVCKRCKDEKVNVKSKGTDAIHAYSIDANMYPGEVPLVLSRLSKVEVLAISRIHMLSQVIQLRYGVYGFRGNSVYLMNNVLDICNELPRKLDDLSHVWLRLLFPESTFLYHEYIASAS